MKHVVPALVVASALLTTSLSLAVQNPRSGSYNQLETSQQEVLGAAHFAVFSLNQDTSNGVYRLEKILSAESQVVAGVNYRLKLLLSHKDGEQLKEVVVFHQAWTQTWQLVSVKDL